MINDKLSSKNLEDLQELVNPETWGKISNKTKSVDLGIQEIQNLVLKLRILHMKPN